MLVPRLARASRLGELSDRRQFSSPAEGARLTACPAASLLTAASAAPSLVASSLRAGAPFLLPCNWLHSHRAAYNLRQNVGQPLSGRRAESAEDSVQRSTKFQRTLDGISDSEARKSSM
jgi:hypothetical protein